MSARAPVAVLGKARAGLLIALTFVLMCLWTVPMLVVAALPIPAARRLNAEVLARQLARTVLALWGLRLVAHDRHRVMGTQTIYVSNHSSTIDLFVLIALGLPNTRYFLKGRLRWAFPLGLIAMLIGTFFTHPQTQPQARVRDFQRAEAVLRRTGCSVYLSPEGTRITTGRIGPFNKGAFHLATNLGAPIVPLYIRIPKDANPGKGLDAGRGTVEIFVQPPIDTEAWRLPELDANRRTLRQVFVELHDRLGTA
jgi:1-acyl-sn-glycerol-3-phosphate acyltransferase